MHSRLLLGVILGIGILSGSAAQGTLARFTTVITSQGNQFSAGTLRIAQLPASSTLAMANLIPGDNFDAQLDISNPGTLPLIYAMTNSITGSSALGTDLMLTVRAKTTTACSTRDGSVLYGPASLSAGAFGNPSHGLDTGDRSLAAGASESLCFTIVLPEGAATTDQDTSLAATFAFLAEQS
jgi:Camelysin metallo-endopeptidase